MSPKKTILALLNLKSISGRTAQLSATTIKIQMAVKG
jgi:hypothetical protein